MGKLDGRFLKNIPSAKNFATQEIVLTKSRIDWSLGSLFRKDLNPTSPGLILRLKFRNVENFRQIILTLVNTNADNSIQVYFPLGYWTNGGTPVTEILPNQRMVLRITCTNNAIYYEAVDGLAPFYLPVQNPTQVATFPALLGNGGGMLSLQDQDNPDITFLGFEYDSVFNTTLQQTGLAIDLGDGSYSPDVSSKLSDIMIRAFCFNEDSSIAYVWGAFGSHYNLNLIDAPAFPDSNPRLLAVDMDTGEAEPIFQSSNAGFMTNMKYMKVEGTKIYLRSDQRIARIDIEAGTVDWEFQMTSPYSGSFFLPAKQNFKIVGNNIYAMTRGYDNVSFGATREVVVRINKNTGVIDNSFHAPFMSLNIANSDYGSWDIDESGVQYITWNTGLNVGSDYISRLYINTNGVLETHDILNTDITSLRLYQGEMYTIERLLPSYNVMSLKKRQLDGTLVTNLATLQTGTGFFDLGHSLNIVNGKIYAVYSRKLKRFNLDGTFDSEFGSPYSGDLLCDIAFTLDEAVAISMAGDGMGGINPMSLGGTSVLTRSVVKYNHVTKEALGTVHFDGIQSSWDDSLYLQIPSVPNRLFLRSGGGYKVYNTLTMIEDTSWFLSDNSWSIMSSVYDNGYIYYLSGLDQVKIKDASGAYTVTVPKGSIARYNVTTKLWDQTFIKPTYTEADNNNGASYISNTPDYFYVTFQRGFGAGSVYQMKKSDWSVTLVPSVATGAAVGYVKATYLEDGKVLLSAPLTGFSSQYGFNLSTVPTSFIIIDELTLETISTAPFRDRYSMEIYDGEGNLYYWLVGGTPTLTKVDVFTFNKTSFTQFSLLPEQWGSVSSVLPRAWRLMIRDGGIYMNVFGYYNRQVVDGICRFNPLTGTLGEP